MPLLPKIFLFFAAVSLLLFSCGSDGGNDSKAVGTYRVQLVFPEDVPRTATNASNIDCDAAQFADIEFAFSIEGAPHSKHSFACSEHKASIHNIPVSIDRVDVNVSNAGGEPLLHGYENIVIQAGKETSGRIALTHVGEGEASGGGETDQPAPQDVDGDGFDLTQDCDDADATVHPGAEEIPQNGIDENCDGSDAAIWYQDADGDGFGDLTATAPGDAPPQGYVAVGTDCDDGDDAIHPEAVEISGNAIDENCDGLVEDEDGDGFLLPEDCDDTDASIFPGAEEIADNGIDEDCDGQDATTPASSDTPTDPGASDTPTGPSSFRIDDLQMFFVRIPAGTFMMGSPQNELGRQDDETLHEVTISRDYYMQSTEVTQDQWRMVAQSSDNSVLNEMAWPSTSCPYGTCPVESVDYNDVQLFLRALNARYEGSYRCRLPTEAEWEYAARAGEETAFGNGEISVTDCSRDPVLDAMGWYCYNSSDITMSVAHPLKTPNAWGLYDMHGNVMEWCSDWYGEYPAGPVVDPQGLSAGQRMVIRGGYYTAGAATCRSAWRGSNTPTRSLSELGFRLVCAQISR